MDIANMVSERFPQLAEGSASEVEALLAACEVHEAAAGEALVAEGTASDALFMVLDGTLDISAGGRRRASVGPGQFFGEVSLLNPGPATADVISEQGCTVVRVTRARLDALGETAPATAAQLVGEVLRSLGERARNAAAQVADARGGLV